MIKEFIPYEQALALKELGFDEPCFGIYNTNTQGQMDHKVIEELLEWFDDRTTVKNSDLHHSKISAPLYQQAFRWFREKYGLHSYIEPVLVEKANSPIKYDYVILEVSHQNDLEYNNLPYHTYEEAELTCLEKLIQIVKDGK